MSTSSVGIGALTLDGAHRPQGARHGSGLANLRARLRHLYGEGDWLVLQPNPHGGTTARLRLPAPRSVIGTAVR